MNKLELLLKFNERLENILKAADRLVKDCRTKIEEKVKESNELAKTIEDRKGEEKLVEALKKKFLNTLPKDENLDKIISIGDDNIKIMNEIEDSIDKYIFIFITGGLGPTHDDVTLLSFKEVFNRVPVNHYELILQRIASGSI